MKGFDPIERAKKLRPRMINLENRSVLLASFAETLQATDIKRSFGWIDDYFRVKEYIKHNELVQPPFRQPAAIASQKLGIPYEECNNAFLFQVKGCNLGAGLKRGEGCWFCYVDNENLIPNPKTGAYISSHQILDQFLAERIRRFYDKPAERVNILRVSGGEPTIVPEIIVWLIEEIKALGLQKHIYLWVDTNLLTGDMLWKVLTKKQVNMIRAHPNIGFCGCYKGFDELSFFENTKADPEFFREQFIMHRRLVENGFDVYSYLDSTCEDTTDLQKRVTNFIKRVREEVEERAPLRLTPLEVKGKYGPTQARLCPEKEKAIENQWQVIKLYQERLEKFYGYQEIFTTLIERAIPMRQK